MPHEQFDRRRLRMKPLRERKNKVVFERDRVLPEDPPKNLNESSTNVIRATADRIRAARANDRPRMLAFGAHTIKNGLSPVLIRLIETGWITHLATNGAGIIHDWELAYLGETSEDVRENIARGEFGAWEETGYYLNLALAIGSYRGLGYGESVGALVENEALEVPTEEALRTEAKSLLHSEPDQAAAAADLLGRVRKMAIEPGPLKIPHAHKSAGLQAAAYRLNVPYTGHPMFGHDIHYMHPLNHGASIGRTAERDFLTYAQAVSRLEGGVYLSVGSAVMSPMVFEKSLSMARNLASQSDTTIESFHVLVVDLSESGWDWSKGEPPEDHPDYYLRYNKTFSRTGGSMAYLSADNRDFLLALLQTLENGN